MAGSKSVSKYLFQILVAYIFVFEFFKSVKKFINKILHFLEKKLRGGGLMSDFGCSGGKHSKYCPIWLKIEI